MQVSDIRQSLLEFGDFLAMLFAIFARLVIDFGFGVTDEPFGHCVAFILLLNRAAAPIFEIAVWISLPSSDFTPVIVSSMPCLHGESVIRHPHSAWLSRTTALRALQPRVLSLGLSRSESLAVFLIFLSCTRS